jgi:N4-(beta-N-acetylglucosaminyl)-L-asparaginase
MNAARVPPVVIASANGHRFRNGGTATCVERAFELMSAGADVLDAVVEGVTIVELDPEDTSVGYGGLPNADGVVQLDACCMHGPRRQAGGVAALEGVRTAARVAARVLLDTDHHLLAGAGARAFARTQGFTIEEDLNTERSRQTWLEWRQRAGTSDAGDAAALRRIELEMIRDGAIDPNHFYGTINCNAVNARGEVCGVTTTSGLAWKLPGRVGDSPILGAGLYVDGDVGAAGSTGRGEANLFSLTSFVVVEEMRRGRHPKDAGLEGLRRIQRDTVTPAHLNSRGLPNFNVTLYVLNVRGEYAGVSLYGGPAMRYALCTDRGAELRSCDPLLDGSATD